MKPQNEYFTPKFKPGEEVYSYQVNWDSRYDSARFAKCFLIDREEIKFVLLTSSGFQYSFTNSVHPKDLYPEEKIFRTEMEARKAFYMEKIRLLEKEQHDLAEYIEETKHEMEKLDEND
ncbi:MAG: hypothetical protein J5858_15150 [Lentisphaeria bacterium]|nr:hypothetical protein [Lentisphaeria bacterium]